MAQYANAVITKARAMYGKMLSPAQYDDLLRRQSVQEISAYLKEKTPYASTLAGVQNSTVHRGQLENLLHKDLFYQYARLIKYVQTAGGVYNYIIYDLEIELILSCLRNIISARESEFMATIPSFIRPYATFDIFGLAQPQSISALAGILRGTLYGEAFARCASKERDGIATNYTHYEAALRTWYFDTLLHEAGEARGKTAIELQKIILTRAEMMNINAIHRLKMYFNMPPDEIRRAVIPVYGAISRRAMDGLIDAKDAQGFMQLLSRTSYGRQIPADTTFIEGRTDHIRYRLDLKLLRFSTNPQVVFMAFMLLRGMETENIVRIIEGVHYQLAPEKIERLIFRP